MNLTRNKAKTVFSLCLLFCFCFNSCSFKESKVKNTVLVQIDDQTLTADEFAKRLTKKLKSYDLLSARDENFINQAKQSIIQEFIHAYIIERWAKENKLVVSKDELQAEFKQIRDQYPDDISFREAFADENEEMEDWLASLRLRLLEKKVSADINKNVDPPSDKELESHYKENKDSYKIKEAIQIRQIVTENLTEAERIKKLLRKGSDFEEIAKKYSISPDADNGGVSSWIERSTLEVFDKAFQLSTGTVSPVWESHFGHHIIQVLKRRPARQPSFSEVKKQIYEELFENKKQAEYTSWVDKQVKSLKVSVNEAALDSISVSIDIQ